MSEFIKFILVFIGCYLLFYIILVEIIKIIMGFKSELFNKIKSKFHFHKYSMITFSKRKCKCGKIQSRVCYPFISNDIFWENEQTN